MTDCKILGRARPAILALKAYSSARSLMQATDNLVSLDANELPAEPLVGVHGYSHYAAQQPPALMKALSSLYDLPENRLMAARGADEAIDILIRAFCDAGADSILVCPPTFTMYAQYAQQQGAIVKAVPLRADFTPDVDAILTAADKTTKLVFLCSPNNPTGTLVDRAIIHKLCAALSDQALIVIDEAYIEFCPKSSCTALLAEFSNLAILRTLSKGYALAGVRCGALLAHPDIIALCRKILAPYPLAVPAVETVLKTLQQPNLARLDKIRAEVLATRDWFAAALADAPGIETVFPSATNFVLVRVADAEKTMAVCRTHGFILRNQSYQPGLQNCLRISMGTRAQMEDLLHILKTGDAPAQNSGRRASITRRTKETAIQVTIDLDHTEPVHIDTGVGFFDHMLEQIARHGGFALTLDCIGDLHIDAHHTIEDCAIALGQALKSALGDKAGIGRYGFTLPMDEALAQAAIDLSGRSFLKFDGSFPEAHVGAMPTDMVAHVFRSLAENMQATIHLSVTGENTHHMVEACFKAFGRALRPALQCTGDVLPSSKGVL